jgi:queuine tRNA-ribosyltransferase
LRHLYIAGEILVLRLLTAHNLHLYGRLVREAREAIASNSYAAFAREWAEAGIGVAGG